MDIRNVPVSVISFCIIFLLPNLLSAHGIHKLPHNGEAHSGGRPGEWGLILPSLLVISFIIIICARPHLTWASISGRAGQSSCQQQLRKASTSSCWERSISRIHPSLRVPPHSSSHPSIYPPVHSFVLRSFSPWHPFVSSPRARLPSLSWPLLIPFSYPFIPD